MRPGQTVRHDPRGEPQRHLFGGTLPEVRLERVHTAPTPPVRSSASVGGPAEEVAQAYRCRSGAARRQHRRPAQAIGNARAPVVARPQGWRRGRPGAAGSSWQMCLRWFGSTLLRDLHQARATAIGDARPLAALAGRDRSIGVPLRMLLRRVDRWVEAPVGRQSHRAADDAGMIGPQGASAADVVPRPADGPPGSLPRAPGRWDPAGASHLWGGDLRDRCHRRRLAQQPFPPGQEHRWARSLTCATTRARTGTPGHLYAP